MNWGYRVTILFIGFAVMMGVLVYKATHTRYELVSKDYYAEELRYQEKIDGMNNAIEAGDIDITHNNGRLELRLPGGFANGVDTAQAWFYCKSNAANDKKLKIVFVDGAASITTNGFAPDGYELKLQFNEGNKPYYYTKPVDLR